MTRKKKLISIGIFLIAIIFFCIFTLRAETLKPTTQTEDITQTSPRAHTQELYKIVKDAVIVPVSPQGNKKVILLTIDDGPTARTLSIMETLKAHNAGAIFFINGIHHATHPLIIKELHKNGFAVGNHTWSHRDLRKEKNKETALTEIDTTTNLIEQETGELPKFFRAPYGMITSDLRTHVKEKGMLYIDWSASAKDWQKNSRERDVFIKHAMDEIHAGSIILIHEYPWSATHLDALLTAIEEKGYSFADPHSITKID